MWLLHWLGVPSLFLILLKGFVDHLIFLMCLLVMFPTFVLLINIFWDKEGEKASGTATRWKNHNQPCEPLSVWQMWLCSMFIRRGVKKRIFYGQADRKRPPPSRSAFCEFLCVFLVEILSEIAQAALIVDGYFWNSEGVREAFKNVLADFVR